MAILKGKKQFDTEFNEAFELYGDHIYRFCLSRLKCNEEYAKDCTQDTFLIFYKRLKNGETFDNPRAFLYRTANNFVKKKYEENQKNLSNQTPLSDDCASLADTAKSIENSLDFKSFQQKLNEILSDEEKALYTKRFIEMKSIESVSEELGINKKYCTVKISRLRQKIRAELGEYRI